MLLDQISEIVVILRAQSVAQVGELSRGERPTELIAMIGVPPGGSSRLSSTAVSELDLKLR